jgi:ABC-2 type transport system ATP-binding protein
VEVTSPVSVEEVRKTYPNGVKALKGVTFTVSDGEIFGLLGPNGAGKSTTIGILTTTVHPTSGRAVVGGHDVVTDPLSVRGVIGVAFQDSVLDNDFSGLQNLRLQARLFGMSRRESEPRIAKLLEAMELENRARDGVRTYSGGMRRRLEIARALLTRPRVLLLDEPTVGLDPAVRHEIWNLIKELRRKEGVTILLSTHYLEEAESVCDRAAIIHEGELMGLDTPTRLVDSLGHQLIEVTVEGDARDAARALDGAEFGSRSLVVLANTVSMSVSGSSSEVDELLGRVRARVEGAEAVTLKKTTLNDVFLHLTARNKPASRSPSGGLR